MHRLLASIVVLVTTTACARATATTGSTTMTAGGYVAPAGPLVEFEMMT